MFRNSLRILVLISMPVVFGCSKGELKPDAKEVKRDEEAYKKGVEQSMQKMPESMRNRAQQQQPGAGS